MGVTMAQREAARMLVKDGVTIPHLPHLHQHSLPYQRSGSAAHSQHPSPQAQSQATFAQPHPVAAVYSQQSQGTVQSPQEVYYTTAQANPYGAPGAAGGYSSTDNHDIMATTMQRPYPPMSYHTPQSNSPVSISSSSDPNQHRSIYGQQPSHMAHQYMYQQQQQQQPQYSPIPPPHQQQQQQQHQQAQYQPQQQTMTSQPPSMMAHAAPQPTVPAPGQQALNGSPRNKAEPVIPSHLPLNMPTTSLPMQQAQQQQQPQPQQVPQQQTQQQPPQSKPALRPLSGPLVTGQQTQSVSQVPTPTSATAAQTTAAPGPIPATTPLVVRQDQNGVQWIAFEYSRDRVKMEYTIRCDVESVNTDHLTPEFKTENCVYPRACCRKDDYRGNRLIYETECNTVGWALAQLNPPLRGKRGLIQRAVDSWRNSNQDPKLRSRRVRRQAKMKQHHKAMAHNQPQTSLGPNMPGPLPTSMVKPTMAALGGAMVPPANGHVEDAGMYQAL